MLVNSYITWSDIRVLAGISTDRSVPLKQEPGQPPKVVADNRLNPDAIAKVCWMRLRKNTTVFISFSQSYLYLAQQDRSAWTWELDRECNQLYAYPHRLLTVSRSQYAPLTRNGE